jgi:hypothetical protein
MGASHFPLDATKQDLFSALRLSLSYPSKKQASLNLANLLFSLEPGMGVEPTTC